MPLHKDLTGSELHEPKGADAAASNTAYFSDGSGSGSWRKITTSDLDTTSLQNPNTIYMTAVIPDVSTPSLVLIPVIDTSTLESVRLTLGGAITVANATISFTKNGGSSLGSNLTITQSGSTEGTSFTFTPTINQSIPALGYVKIATDGGSTGEVPLFITLKFTRTP